MCISQTFMTVTDCLVYLCITVTKLPNRSNLHEAHWAHGSQRFQYIMVGEYNKTEQLCSSCHMGPWHMGQVQPVLSAGISPLATVADVHYL